MPSYEMMFIAVPNEEKFEEAIQRYTEIIKKNSGVVEQIDKWGKKRLAFEINNYNDGIYGLITFDANAECVKELDRVIKQDENNQAGALRHMIIRKGC